MTRRAVFLAALWAGAALALVACSEGKEALTRAGFLAKGNEICAKTQKAIDDGAGKVFTNPGLVPTAEEVSTFVEDYVEPQLRIELRELSDLEPPEDDRDRVDDILDAGRRGLTAVDDNPVLLIGGEQNPLTDYSELAGAYGLKACGRNSDETARKLAGIK